MLWYNKNCMSPSPKVSVLIPAHNEESYIGPCLESILAINYTHLEIIVCNNNSTDRTCEIVAHYPTVKLVHETKPGPNAARQKALSVATGEIVVTLDADCVVPKDWIERGIKHFASPKVVGTAGVFYFDGKPALRALLYVSTHYVMRFLHWLMHRVLRARAIMPAGNAWFRKSALLAIGGFNTDILFYGDDAHTALLLGKQGIIHYDPNLVVSTSPRRFEQGGTLKTMYRYVANYVSMWTVKRHATSHAKTQHYR